MVGQPKTRAKTGREPAKGASRTPARGYSWPPFPPGNELSLRHGAFSKRKVSPVVVDLVAGLVAQRPELLEYPETLVAWARAEARCLLLDEWLADVGFLDADGEPRAALRYVSQYERLAVELRARLGLDPRSEAELHRERASAQRSAIDLEAVRAEGRRSIEARAVEERDS